MEKIILDCDPGHDDAFAIMLAAGAPEIELLGITTVAGNQTLPKVTRNALAVCAVAGIQPPVAAGADRPLIQERIVAPYHGGSGLDGPVLQEARFALDPRHAVDFLIDTLMAEEPDSVHLVPIGPLTNIALAARKEPAIVERVKSVVLMGGGYAITGNITPTGEFNIYADPDAAHAVFAADWDVTMVGLDLTHQATPTPEVLDAFRALESDLGEFIVDMLDFIAGKEEGFNTLTLHDPCAVAAVIDPAVITTQSAFVTVERHGEWTKGMTVTDFRGVYGRPARTKVAIDLDRDRFWALVIDAVRRLDSAS
jgi:purine nucleosidase